jgi:hypothetical protein
MGKIEMNRGKFSLCGKLMPIKRGTVVLALSSQPTAFLGLPLLCPAISQLDLFLDCADRFGRYLDKFDPDPHSRQAIADFAARADFNPRKGQPKIDVQDSALWELAAGIDEHAAGADIRRSGDNVFAEPLIADGKLAEAGEAGSKPR